MKTARFEVLSADEVARIHNASLTLLDEVGIKVDYPTARAIFREAGADVDDDAQVVRLSPDLVMRSVAAAPKSFALHGLDPVVRYPIGPEQAGPMFAGLGTPTRIVDMDTGQIRAATAADVLEHIILIDGLDHIHNSQMDMWPDDIPMTTIHTEAIWEWAHHSRKSFGMGCYGYLPTWDMMRMMAIAVGGKAELRQRPALPGHLLRPQPAADGRQQAEGLLICAEYGQPLACLLKASRGHVAGDAGRPARAGKCQYPRAHCAGAVLPARARQCCTARCRPSLTCGTARWPSAPLKPG